MGFYLSWGCNQFGVQMKPICKRCAVVHTQDPVDPVDPDAIMDPLMQEIADQIDAEILAELLELCHDVVDVPHRTPTFRRVLSSRK